MKKLYIILLALIVFCSACSPAVNDSSQNAEADSHSSIPRDEKEVVTTTTGMMEHSSLKEVVQDLIFPDHISFMEPSLVMGKQAFQSMHIIFAIMKLFWT